MASVIWDMFEKGISGEIFNIAGKGTISPSEIYSLYKSDDSNSLHYDGFDLPRIVEVDTTKIEEYCEMQDSYKVVSDFLYFSKAKIGGH